MAGPQRWIGGLCLLFVLNAQIACGVSPPQKTAQASTSRASQQQALQAVPLDRLTAASRKKATAVLANVTLFRRLPAQVIECEPDFYRFLVEHPELVVNIWEVMGVSNIMISRLSPSSFQADDKAGTLAKVEFLHKSPECHLIYAEGSYQGALFPKAVRGKCLLHLRTTAARNKSGRAELSCRLEAFIQINNLGVEVLAKTFSPLIGQVGDHNFEEINTFIARLNQSASTNPAAIERLAGRLGRVAPADQRLFAELATKVAVKSAPRGRPLPLKTAAQVQKPRASAAAQATPAKRTVARRK